MAQFPRSFNALGGTLHVANEVYVRALPTAFRGAPAPPNSAPEPAARLAD
jgi:hypothetical protein